MQNRGDFKLCASLTDVVNNFAVIKSVIIKRVHCIGQGHTVIISSIPKFDSYILSETKGAAS